MTKKQTFIYFLFCFALLGVCACGNEATKVSSNNAQGAPSGNNAVASNPASSQSQGGGGEPIDTSKYDAAVDSAKKQADSRPNDASARAALAHAYLARANALRDARQYRVALGDYRRTLQYDPENRDAQQNAAMIIMIMKQMGREVPEPGQEPTPLPYGGNAAARQAAPASNNSAPLLKSH